MKFFSFALLAITMVAIGCSTKADPNILDSGKLVVSGKVAGMAEGSLELLNATTDSIKVDTIAVKEGSFTFETTLAEPSYMALRVIGTQRQELVFFADPGKVTITSNVDSFQTGKVEAGASQKIYAESEKGVKDIMKDGEKLYGEYMQAQQTGDMAKVQLIDSQFVAMQDKAVDYAKDFAMKNATSPVSAFMGISFLNDPAKMEDLKALYAKFTPAVKSSYFGKKIGETVDAATKTAIGSIAPDFIQPDATGNPVALSSLRGKVVLVDFWASWCAPCRQENPNVVAAYNQFKDKGFDILGVSLDEDAAAWAKAIIDDKLTWHHVGDMKGWTNAAAAAYGIRSIPASFLIDKDGKIIARDLRGPALSAKLAEILN